MNDKPAPPYAADVMEAAGFCNGLSRTDKFDFSPSDRLRLKAAGMALEYFGRNAIWNEPKKKKKV